MTKTKKTILIVVVSILVLSFTGVVAYAATNISKIEELYLAFRNAQVDAAVESGEMTEEEADTYLENLNDRLEEDENDAVPPLKGRGNSRGGKGGMFPMPHAIQEYAEIIGADVADILDTLRDEGISIFALADNAGKLDELKDAMLEDAYEHIDKMVADGRFDADEAAEAKAAATEKINAITADTNWPVGIQDGRMGSPRSGEGMQPSSCPNEA